jgi:hypothetical protein
LKYSSMFLFVNMNKYDVTKYHKLDIMNICWTLWGVGCFAWHRKS